MESPVLAPQDYSHHITAPHTCLQRRPPPHSHTERHPKVLTVPSPHPSGADAASPGVGKATKPGHSVSPFPLTGADATTGLTALLLRNSPQATPSTP